MPVEFQRVSNEEGYYYRTKSAASHEKQQQLGDAVSSLEVRSMGANHFLIVHFARNTAKEYTDHLKQLFSDAKQTGSAGYNLGALSPEDRIRAIAQLSTPQYENGPGLISKEAADYILAEEIKAWQSTDAGKDAKHHPLLTFSPYESDKDNGPHVSREHMKRPVKLLNVKISYPHSRVTRICEDGEFAALNQRSEREIFTDLDIPAAQDRTAIAAAAQAAGVKVKTYDTEQKVRMETTADHVAEILGKAGFLPDFLAEPIRQQAESEHPGQREINAALVEKRPAALEALRAKQKPNASPAIKI